MDSHQPVDPGVPIWYVGHHLPRPDATIAAQTLADEIGLGVSISPPVLIRDLVLTYPGSMI